MKYLVARFYPKKGEWQLIPESRDVFQGDVVIDVVESEHRREWVCSRTGRPFIIFEKSVGPR